MLKNRFSGLSCVFLRIVLFSYNRHVSCPAPLSLHLHAKPVLYAFGFSRMWLWKSSEMSRQSFYKGIADAGGHPGHCFLGLLLRLTERRAHAMQVLAPCRAQTAVCVYERDKNSVSGEQGILVMSEREEGEQTHEIKFGSRQSSQ